MVLAIECIIGCLLFTIIMVGGVLLKRESFLSEYAPEVQEQFLKNNPGFKLPEKKAGGISAGYLAAKILMSLLFIAILTTMVFFAGATTFAEGALFAYVIWFVVNWFDVFALDMGVFAYWKKVRLPGTEHMDVEYRSNATKHLKDGLFGTVLGIPIALICGFLLSLFV